MSSAALRREPLPLRRGSAGTSANISRKLTPFTKRLAETVAAMKVADGCEPGAGDRAAH
jgi:hypothetical protein